MSNFFIREARLVIGDDILGGVEITDLRFSFKVEQSLVGYPNQAEIKIYNMSKDSRNELKDKYTKINLYAGYEDNAPLIFKGDLVNVTHEKNATEWETNLFCGDAHKVLKEATINKTLPPGTTSEKALIELVGEMKGVTKGITDGLKNCGTGNKSLLRSMVLAGNVKDIIEMLSKRCGFDYSINNGVLETTAKNKPLSDEPEVEVRQDNGMIGSPEITEYGIKVKSLMIPHLKLGRKIAIKSVSAKINIGNLIFRKVPKTIGEGTYRADKIIHIGDTHSNDWFTEISARTFNG